MEKTVAVASLFSSGPTVVKESKEREPIVPDTEENKPYLDRRLSMAQIREREARTVFVGNVHINSKRKTLKKQFDKYGTVEAIWFRSVPVNSESKVPIRGKVALKDFVEHSDSMNAYILFANTQEAEAATQENNKEFLGKFLRVSLANQKDHDVKTTVFVGNLFYKTKDEELREFFKECGEITGLRIIRDPITHVGKGFAYVKFANKQGYLSALTKNKAEFMQRELRVKKAVDIEQDNKKKAIIRNQQREKEFRVERPTSRMNQEDIASRQNEDKKMQEFSKKALTEDEMTAGRAEEIFKTKGRVFRGAVRGQIKKIKKQGIKGAEATEQINWVKEKAQRRMTERIFHKRDEMKHRRDVRKIKKNLNNEKYKAFKSRSGREGRDVKLNRG